LPLAVALPVVALVLALVVFAGPGPWRYNPGIGRVVVAAVKYADA